MNPASNPKKETLKMLMMSFAPLLAFYGVEHFFGLKIAIGATVGVTIGEIIYRKMRKEALGGFFYFIAITTIGFGLIDVFSSGTSFFKYEPAITNLVTGIYFIWGAAQPIPLIQEFAQKAGKIPENPPPALTLYLRVMTWIWVVYFLIKGIVYFAIANEPETSTGKMMVIRTLAGNASMFIMLAVSWLGGKPIYKWAMKRVLSRKPMNNVQQT